jgi:hypothetical protein
MSEELFSKENIEAHLPEETWLTQELFDSHKKAFNQTGSIYYMYKNHALGYANWLIENCIIAREGFRIGTSNWSEVISNERAYELYLESLKK